MTLEAWTVIGVGLILGALNIGLFKWLHGDLKQLGERMIAVEKEQARVAGLLEGLGLTGRATPTAQSGAD